MKNTNPQQLSMQGRARKQSMLDELHHELQRHTNRSIRRRRSVGVFALVIITGAAMAYSLSSHESVVDPGHHTAATTAKFMFASVESNRQQITDRYVVSNEQQPSISFESLSDDELVVLLKSTGDKYVLGEIDGQKLLLPARMTP